ncbi:MAG: C4-dicarboxylate transporter [Bacteroidetes bacterium]|nr:C4-dicarboxylate transporter [Bacteroidota bacterium]
MLNRRGRIYVTAVLSALLVGTWAGPGGAGELLVKLSHPQAPGSPFDIMAQKFSELADKKSNAQIKVQVFPGAQLGNERDALEGVVLGTVGATFNSPGMLGNTWKPIGVLDIPYLFRDWDHVVKVLKGPIGQNLTDRMAKESGVRALAWANYGFRHLWTSNRAVRTLSDIQGLKMRAPEIPLYMETWRALGATVVPMPAAEMYTALQQGVVFGQENPIGFTFGLNLHEVLKYVTRTYHMAGILSFSFNEKSYQSLPPNLRTALTDAAWEAAKFNDDRLVASEGEMLEKMKTRGMIVIDVDRKPFVDATAGVREKFGTDKELVQRIMATQ